MPPEIVDCWLETEDGRRGDVIELEPSFESRAIFKVRIRDTRDESLPDERRWVTVEFFIDGQQIGSSGLSLLPAETRVFDNSIEGESVRRFAEQQGVEPRVNITADAKYGRD